jgi:hypothetical protein
LDSLYVSVELTPPSKGALASARLRARQTLHAALSHRKGITERDPHTRWPRPRAAVALDIALHGDATRAPRVDTICKWLLDELKDHVYRDDRQVKLLFAHADRRDKRSEAANSPIASLGVGRVSQTTDPHDDPWDEPWAQSDASTEASTRPELPTSLHIHARTRSNVLATLRTAAELPYDWDPIDDDDDYKFWNPYVRLHAGGRDRLIEYREWLQTGTDPDPDEVTRTERELDYHDQASQQQIVDIVFSSLLTFLPAQRFLGWNILRRRLETAPYIFDLGVLPAKGGSRAFKARLRQFLEQRRAQYPDLFPMRAKSGISLVLFEDSAHGKDLDNLIRTVLPDVLDVLRPPRTDLPGWVAAAPDIETAFPDIPFIEAAAIPAGDADMPPGNIVFGLSGGHRYQSWWAKAESTIERRLDRLTERD